jgi:hypothetical protein
MLKRSRTLAKEAAGDRRRVRTEVVDEARQRPPYGGHQIRVVCKIRELARQRRPLTDWNLTLSPGAPVDTTARGGPVLSARNERAPPSRQQRFETADDGSSDQPRRHFASRTWDECTAAQGRRDRKRDAGENLAQRAPPKPRTDENAGRHLPACGRDERDRSDSAGGAKQNVQAAAAVNVRRQTKPLQCGSVGHQERIDPSVSLSLNEVGADPDGIALVGCLQKRTGGWDLRPRAACPTARRSAASHGHCSWMRAST